MPEINAIKNVDADLHWSKESYDVGHQKYKCAICEKKIGSHDVPTRLWRGEGKATEECLMHMDCFIDLIRKGLFKEIEIGEKDRRNQSGLM